MSEIIELWNIPKFLEKSDRSFRDLCMVTEDVPGVPKSIFKLELISICEVFGYQIAEAIGVRVPQMQGFWTPDETMSTFLKLFVQIIQDDVGK